MRKSIVAAAFGLMLLFAGRAHASGSGYPCWVEHDPGASSYYGNVGGFSIGLYSGPNCTGSYVMWGQATSTGATACSPSFSEATLLSMLESLREAMWAGKKLFVSTVGGSGCIQGFDLNP